MRQAVGLDVGYGFVKITDGNDGYVFPSVVGAGHETTGFSLNVTGPAEDVDDLRVTVDGQLHYVGKLAVERSKLAFRGLSDTRWEGNGFKVLFLAALSLFCRQSPNVFTVVTGLPPGRMHLRDRLLQDFQGEHHVLRHTRNGAKEMRIHVDHLTVVPQPLGSYWVSVLDSTGQLRDDSRLTTGRVGIIDVGFGTSDLAMVQNGDYVSEFSTTIPVGSAAAYDEIAGQLSMHTGIERETYALDAGVLTGVLTRAGQQVSIQPIVDQAMQRLAAKILVEIRSKWRLEDIDHILITGGGGEALSRSLLQHLPQGKVVPDAMTANSRGYLVWANRLTS